MEQIKITPDFKEKIIKLWEYIKGFYQHYNKFPKMDKLLSYMKIERDELVRLLRILEIKKVIKRRHANYSLPGTGKRKKKIKKQISFETQKETLEKIIKKSVDVKILVLKIIILVIGSIATVMSIIYSMIWFLSMMDFFRAFLLSVCMVGFSVVAFEIIILFVENKQKLPAFIFSFLWLIVLLFSMISTIAGQYNQYHEKKKNKEEESSKNNSYLIFQELNQKELLLTEEIKNRKTERDRIQKLLLEYDEEEKIAENERRILNHRKVIYSLNKEIEKLNADLFKIKDEKKILLEKENVKEIVETDFYGWVSEIIKINPHIIQFILSIFPAVFIDMIAPLSFAVVLFYRRKEDV